jgi:hypothetical protein
MPFDPPVIAYQIGTSGDAAAPFDFAAEAARLRVKWQGADTFGREADKKKIRVLIETRHYLRAAQAGRGLFFALARGRGIRYGKLETKVLRYIGMRTERSRTAVNRFASVLAWLADQPESDVELIERVRPMRLGDLESIAAGRASDVGVWDSWWGFGTQGEGNVEYWTPRRWFEVMEVRFDIDAASPGADLAPWIPAARHYTKADDGLAQPWHGRVYLNPPWGEGDMLRWVNRFVQNANGIMLIPDSTSTVWFQRLVGASDMMLLVSKKIRFQTPQGLAPSSFPRGTALFAIGDECVRGLIRAHRAGMGVLMVLPSAALLARYEECDAGAAQLHSQNCEC